MACFLAHMLLMMKSERQTKREEALTVTTRTAELVENIANLAEQLQQDVDQEASKQPVFSDIREIRRSLNTLEQELRGETISTTGDAC